MDPVPWTLYKVKTVGWIEDSAMRRADEFLTPSVIVYMHSLVSALPLAGYEITIG
jgi:hypothetical protein